MAEREWPRLVTAVAATLIAMAISGLYGGVWGIYAKLGDVSARQAVIQSQVADARAAMQGVYTRAEAKKDFAAVWATDKDQYQRIEDHETRIRALEKREHR